MQNGKTESRSGAVMSPIQDQVNLSPRILVAEDDVDIRELMAENLVRSGYEVDTAKDGADAWKALNQTNYYLLITDYKMPRVTGVELIKKLRSEDMALPVILVSGTMPTEELTRHPWLRIDATLSKPFTVEELLGVVKKVLNTLVETPFADMMLDPKKLAAALKTAKTPPAEKPSTAPVRGQNNPSHRILVVDDNADTRLLSMDVLTDSGYEVEGAKDGAAGWEALQTCDYDLVVTDNQMPRMTGIEMLAKLYATRLTIPVIMATGNLPTDEFARKPWLTPDATLQRPFTNDDLVATVKKVLSTDDSNKAHMKMLLPLFL
jgi:DNA-binding response OmpR family regulator